MEEEFEKIEFVDSIDQLDAFKDVIEDQVQQEETTEIPQQTEAVDDSEPQGEFIDNSQEQYTEGDIESAVLEYLSERLGRQYNSIEQIIEPSEVSSPPALDEGLQAIADFVQQTGRSPYDWFLYQSMNPSEMDDISAIRTSMKMDHPDLSNEDIDLLISKRYSLDEGLYEDNERRLGSIQLRIDAKQARNQISEMRDQFMAPVRQESQQDDSFDSIIDDEWVRNMSNELDSLEGVEFDLGDGKAFRFGLDSRYKNELRNKNIKLDEFFNPYVRDDGSWDYDLLNTHRAVIDNIDNIVKSVYKQGLGDGQRNIVNRAANVNQAPPSSANTSNQTPSIIEQLSPFFSGESLTFKL
jgi:hypothetical protein